MNEFSVLIIFCEMFILILLGGLAVYAIYQLTSIRTAPYVPSTPEDIKLLLSKAGVKPGTRLVDLGSGMGDICFAAAQLGAIATGIERNPMLVLLSRLRTPSALRGQVHFIRANFFRYQVPENTDVVALYLLPHALPGVWKKLNKELRPGATVVSNAFAIPGVEPTFQQKGARLYLIP